MLKDYLRSRLKVIILIFIVIGVFASSYFLFDMPAVTVLYPLVLCAFILLIAGVVDFLITLNKHKKLTVREMPNPVDPIEKDYQEIISKLKEEEEFSHKKSTSDYNNMVEYYTVWAHQIKTPIASMRLQIQSEDSDLARRLDSDLNRIEAYVEMVLTFLRLDSDSTDYVIREISLDDVIKPAIRKFARDFISKKLRMDFKPTGAMALSDEKWLSFVIEQVISNAVKYTSTGGISIYMKDTGILCIEDTGIGISSEDLPRIFENGYTGFNGREDKRASGIGLYLCKRICDNLGHKISAESKQGEGTKILIDLNSQMIGIE
ncbi:sensor histidine kinase [Butyrivibrio sp. AE2032]|uniref:sensor histidine kinase n=1 Tax=Butyrivibrio sp. AE2032 TaxID=1458463 RepID=UPI000558DA9B|nr:sensor histidine kinase [Butyrivibrio sp. AE2032]